MDVLKKVHESISDLICLRYLDLSNTSIQSLPHAICNLCNMQTLNLSSCGNLLELPFGLANITGLRHLNIVGCESLTRLPAGLGNFQLQTLPLYIVGKEIGESISEIICLNLRGELSIRCLENIRDKEEATLANLRAKKYVELLSLQWGRGNEEKIVKLATGSTSYEVCREVDGTSRSLQSDNDIVVECILECLHPHVNLKKLISRDKCPNLITAPTFQSLLYLELRDCHPS